LYKEEDQSDRVYGKGGRLLKDEEYHYKYDVEGHLILKSKRRINEKLAMPKHDNILDKWLGSGKPSKEAQLAHENWQLGDWGYVWYGNGRLKEVKNPDGSVVKMEYDALGRRTSKRAQGKVTRFFWDGNVLLHEWNHKEEDTPAVVVDAIGMLSYDKVAPIENLVTWVYESGRFVPSAKLVGGERYSILSDYLGTPIQAYDARGNIVWECELDIYGKVRNLHGEKTFIPFRFSGQYEDVETGLYYNRFRYYSPDTGTYISQDPIGLRGNNPNFYAYVYDANTEVDLFGLIIVYRALNGAQEASALAGEAIQPKDINAAYTIQEHIDDGKLQTQFISTTKKRKTANFYAKPFPRKGKMEKSTIISIDTDKLPSGKTFDMSSGINPQTGKELTLPGLAYARKDAEVLIEGEIPKSAYTICK
ncbi:RHS repeat-associated core domain-containing protein, partial [Tenacibaculum maritimum]|uniref:RHS repeat domain-containing protein n=5 Tax=Tenacibaculum maritimum TaxID=107401 RepID=UPI00293E5696